MASAVTDNMSQRQSVLVTGGTGFIGRSLVQRLLEQNYSVTILSRQQQPDSPDAQSCRYVVGEITDKQALASACSGIDTVFHLAAYAHVNQHDTVLMRQTNVEGTRLLLEAAIENSVKRIVFFSSVLAAAPQEHLTEYGRAKRESEDLLLGASAKGDIEVCCLRPANVYGLGMQGNLLTMIKLMAGGQLPPLPTPSASMSLVGSRDLCEAALLAATAPQANNQIYFVTDGRTYSFKGLENNVRTLRGKPPVRWSMPLVVFYFGALVLELAGKVLRFANAPGLRSYKVLTTDNVFSCEKLQRELGYNPASTLGDELGAIVQQLDRK